jgi:predicted regulator of Ras-like GTPase activity (Roadblock/LC7/MglB family)
VTVHEARAQLLELLEDLGAIQGVRGAIIATADGALASGSRSGLPAVTANDVAKTVRRMTVASATVGVPLQELLINFGAARMMVIPLRDDATVVVLLERDTAVAPVRNLLNVQLGELRELLDAKGNPNGDAPDDDEVEDEIGRIMRGELGPVLDRIAHQFSIYVGRAGKSREEASELMREQLREWLLCCNPSPYTLPLLVDGLGLTLTDSPTARGEFMEVVQNTIRNVPAERAR